MRERERNGWREGRKEDTHTYTRERGVVREREALSVLLFWSRVNEQIMCLYLNYMPILDANFKILSEKVRHCCDPDESSPNA